VEFIVLFVLTFLFTGERRRLGLRTLWRGYFNF